MLKRGLLASGLFFLICLQIYFGGLQANGEERRDKNIVLLSSLGLDILIIPKKKKTRRRNYPHKGEKGRGKGRI